MIILTSCGGNNNQNTQSESNQLNVIQEQLQAKGWKFITHQGGDMAEEYGVKPKYGIQDNYFDIQVGSGYDVVVKIVDIQTDQCIRCVYVPQNTTITTNEIPQGRYYLKLAYGNDWMEYADSGQKEGKFTKNNIYERSYQAYDFGKKNSQEVVNDTLKLNVISGMVENNFKTEEISEEEFMKN